MHICVCASVIQCFTLFDEPKGGEGQMKECSHKLMIWLNLQGGSTQLIFCYILVLSLNVVVQFAWKLVQFSFDHQVCKAKGFWSPSNRGRLLEMDEAHLYLALVCLM